MHFKFYFFSNWIFCVIFFLFEMFLILFGLTNWVLGGSFSQCAPHQYIIGQNTTSTIASETINSEVSKSHIWSVSHDSLLKHLQTFFFLSLEIFIQKLCALACLSQKLHLNQRLNFCNFTFVYKCWQMEKSSYLFFR